MPGEITGEEGNSECCDNLTSEVKIESSARRSDAKRARQIYDLGLKYISDSYVLKKIIIAAAILVIALIIVIIILAVTKIRTCPSCQQSVACPDSWIGYSGKCFYVSKEERNWSLSLTTCSSFNASLAVIDSQKELDFWIVFFQHIHFWFGLSKENKIWKWSNGTEFKNQFPMRAEGFCAYVNERGASSTLCSMEKHFFCSQPENCRKPG